MHSGSLQLIPALALAAATVGSPAALPAQEDEAPPPTIPTDLARRSGVFTVYVENDYFAGTDKNYSNGVKLSWLSPDLPEWGQEGWRRDFLRILPFVNRPDTQKNLGVSLGQNIYTPSDTAARVPDPADRPYAGWSYLEFTAISKTATRADIVSLQLGLIGPSSLAENAQDAFHDAIDDEKAGGWDYQLEDEPGFNFIYERRHRLAARTLFDSVGFDFIPHGGFSLGNVNTHANAGGTVRFGLNLPSDFGVGTARGASIGASPIDDLDPRVAPDRDLSLYLFAGVDGRAVARDIFLDGNTWTDSRRVNRETFVADLVAGVGFIVGRWQLTAAFVHRTKEFETQPDPWSRFGSVTLSAAF